VVTASPQNVPSLSLCLQHTPRRGHDRLVATLHDTVLLGCVWCRELATQSELGAVHGEVHCSELTTPIGTECEQLLPGLPLRGCLDALDGRRCSILGRQQHQPHMPRVVINQKEEIAVTTRRWRRDRATEVAVEELESLGGALQCLLWERRTTLLPGHARVAELFHLVEQG
jgi:hypothetical protein